MNERATSPDEGNLVFCLRPVRPTEGLKIFCVPLKDVITVGRHPSNTVVIPLESVSRYHARIERSGDRLMIFDLNSSNGTYIEKQRITVAPLGHNQTVTFGDVEFRCELLEPSEAAAYAPPCVQFLSTDQVPLFRSGKPANSPTQPRCNWPRPLPITNH